jgi:type I restriction enzyme S subunit
MTNLIEALTSASDWISAQEAFRLCGVGVGTETAVIERIYEELRDHIDSGRMVIDRRGEADWLCLSEHRGA